MKLSTTDWLRREVTKLAREIAATPLFESREAPTRSEIEELRARVVIYRFLEQELGRRQRAARRRNPAKTLEQPVLV